MRIRSMLLAAAALGCAPGCASRGGASVDLPRLRAGLPVTVRGWTAADAGTLYDPESIFSYIDGQAEVYRAYGMRGCLARRYAGPEGEPDLALDVFDMGSAADAFGVFTHDRDGEPASIGQGSLLRYGWLSFWKGRFFVSILAERDTAAARDAVTDLGRAVAGAIPEEGAVPAIVAALPAQGLDPRSVRYLHDPQILRTHVAVAGEEAFGLGPGTPAALGSYVRSGDRAHLLIVDHNDAAAAARACGALGDRFPARVAERRLAVVLDATSPATARALLDEALRPGEGGGR